MPARPSKGATIFRRAAVARARASLASATWRLAALSSSVRRLMKFCATSSSLRLLLAIAILSSAWACWIWAMGNWSSNWTSNWPFLTRSPSRKLSWVMRPLTSGRKTTLWRERSEPTVCDSSTRFMRSTLATSTVGFPPPLPPPADALAAPCGAVALALLASPSALAGWFWYHQAPPPTAAIPKAAITG